jgi:hypothetical protein
MNENDCVAEQPRMPQSAMTPGMFAEVGSKLKSAHETSYIDHQPDNQVVLSPRLEQLVRRVGGCQTEEVLALVRRIIYEALISQKR